MAASFSQLGAAALWLLDPQPAGCEIAYTPLPGTSTPPATLALGDSWTAYPGAYAFVPTGATAAPHFLDRLTTFSTLQPRARFAWIANPGDDARAWEAATITFDGGVTSGLSPVALNNIAVWIGAGCRVATDPGQDSLVLTPPTGRAYLTTGAGEASVPAGQPLSVAFTGDLAGCLATSLSLDPATHLDDLDVGMRIFAADSGSVMGDRLLSWRFPFLRTAGAPIPVEAVLDPLNPLEPLRTYFGLVPPKAQAPELGSYYATTHGGRVTLTPLAVPPAKFVLAPRAVSLPPSPYDPYYLIPSGAFGIRVFDPNGKELDGAQRLMCGISGVEYVTLALPDVTLALPGSQVWFSPGGDALVTDRGLTSGAGTAYASVFGPEGASLAYRAQPDGSTLFRASSTPVVLEYHELDGIPLQQAPMDGSLPKGFPMLAFTGIEEADPTPQQDLEYQKVAPARRADIKPVTADGTPELAVRAMATNGGGGTKTTTRQGLLALIDGANMDVQLAQSGKGAALVELAPVSSALAGALQSNQLFLVASDASTLGTVPAGTGALTIGTSLTDSWTLDILPPGGWTTPPTLLVFKFAGKALETLAADISTWSGADVFNPKGTASVVQQRLLGIVADAKKRALTDPDFAPFASIVTEPTWQGILALDCDVPLDELPEQLAGLAAGIDPSTFSAHHVGMTVTPVQADQNGLTTQDSSIFGLIDYISPTTAASAPPPYAFQVDTLKVRFANSAVVTFASSIQLLVDELFGEPATLQDSVTRTRSATNLLLLDGVYQLQGGVGTYSFHATQDNLFTMTSAVLDSVDVATAQFVTVTPPTKGDDTKLAESRFPLTGSMRFKPPPEGQTFDLFSFGPKSDGTPSGELAYSNLAIDLVYYPDRSKPNEYTFDATAISFDAAQSTSRPDGLFASFPLSLSGLVQVDKPAAGTTGTPATPASLGFLGVQADAAGGTIGAPWFGLVADLGLGTAGALASEVGFKASLLAAWTPGKGDTPNAAVGLRLPGTSGSGGKLLSLENVLKLKIAELTMARAGATYVLELDRISISLLSLTFPPSGQTEFLLFADPTGSDHTTLGWFAGYAKDGGGA